MHKKKRRPEIVTQTRWQAANDDHVIERERRSDSLLTWLVILTLVLGIAAMSVDYLWKILTSDSAEVQADAPPSEPAP